MLGRLWRRLRALLRRDSLDRELDAELRYHMERQVAEHVAGGMTAEEARRAALRDFGGVTLSQEQCREARGVRPVEDLRQDVLFGLRVLRRNPVFSLVAVVTLALGIGANTALFSITNAVVFRPLPFAEPERLLTLWESSAKSEDARNIVSPANYLDWREQTRSFKEMGAYVEDFYNLSEDDTRPERVSGANATPSLFRALGVRPVLGRVFLPEEGRPDARVNAVLLRRRPERRREDCQAERPRPHRRRRAPAGLHHLAEALRNLQGDGPRRHAEGQPARSLPDGDRAAAAGRHGRTGARGDERRRGEALGAVP